MTMPLEGIRILDWTQYQQGPVAAMMLADLGAEVVKIEEKPLGGDAGRGMVRMFSIMLGEIGGRNAYFEFNNRGKKSFAVDLRNENGQELVHKLVEKSDVFIHNHKLDYPKRLNLDYETLQKINPKLIYVNSSGWGPQGPETLDRSFDYTGQAKTGFMFAGVEPGYPPMQNMGGGPADQVGAIMSAYAIMTALFARERFGIGQEVHTSLLGATLWLQGLALSMACLWGRGLTAMTRSGAGNPLWNHYHCKDEKWIVLAHLQPDRFWPNVCKAIGIEHLQDDARFNNMMSRGMNATELIKIMDEIFATKDRAEWMQILKENECISAPVNRLEDLLTDPQVLANEYIIDFEHPAWGNVKWPGLPVQFSKTPGDPRKWAPEFGEHSEQVLIDILGYTWDDITKLKDAEVI